MIAKFLTALIAMSMLFGFSAHAEYPDHPIVIIVPAPAGGGMDSVGRIIGNAIAKNIGQSVVVQNVPGAGTQLAVGMVARKAEADGYTVVLGSPGGITAGVALNPDVPYSPRRDLANVGRVALVPNVLAANPNFQVTNLQELIDFAKHKGDRMISYGTGGIGTSQHLAMELLLQEIHVPIVHVPYKGTPQSALDAISGEIQLVMGDPGLIPHVKSGKLRALGVTTAVRSKAIPDVPTLAEQGVPGFEAPNWYGLFVPKKTPLDVVNRLNKALNDSLAQSDVQKELLQLGIDPAPASPEEFQKFIDTDLARYTNLVNKVGPSIRAK
jgi:tripartite-type tricarboxylate transporter receptor subunit TctC